MPGLTMHRFAIYLHSHTLENVFRARVEGMKRGCEGREFDFRRREAMALGEERLDSRQEAPQLFAFRGLLFAKFIPRGRVHSPCVGSG